MQKIDQAEIRTIDITSTIIPPEEPFGPDQISTRVLNESLIYPLKKYQSAIDDSTYLMVTLKSHLGTHVECPNHLLPNGKDITEFPVETWFGRMVFFKFDLPPQTPITRNHLIEIDQERLKGKDIVLLHSTATKKDEVPQLTPEVGHYFLEKKVKMVGFDTSIGFALPAKGNTHDILLENNVPLLEWVINLDKLQQDVSYLISLPGLKVKSMDASPVCAVVLEGMEVR